MGRAIQPGTGQGVVAEHLGPLIETAVAGQDERVRLADGLAQVPPDRRRNRVQTQVGEHPARPGAGATGRCCMQSSQNTGQVIEAGWRTPPREPFCGPFAGLRRPCRRLSGRTANRRRLSDSTLLALLPIYVTGPILLDVRHRPWRMQERLPAHHHDALKPPIARHSGVDGETKPSSAIVSRS